MGCIRAVQHDPDTLPTAAVDDVHRDQDPPTAPTSRGDGQLKIFINYRRDDAAAHARLLYDRLAGHFGAENVFLDIVNLQPGVRWIDEIRSQSAGAGVLLALIGRRWAELLSERASGGEDHVRSEIEAALRAPHVEVIPTLLDDASMPSDQQVPSSLRPLLRRNATAVRLTTLDSDVDALVAHLEEVATTMAGSTAAEDVQGPPPPEPSASSEVARTPDLDHYAEVVRLMLDEASLVVPFLGPATNSSDRDEVWFDAESGYLPDADELAAYLTRKLELAAGVDLARASQYVWELRPGDLYGTLRTSLMTTESTELGPPLSREVSGHGEEARPGAALPADRDDELRRRARASVRRGRGAVRPRRLHGRAVSNLRDGADATSHRGRFLHVPHDGEPRVVDEPNKYLGFPFTSFTFGLERTVILKIHGAVDTDSWRNNYVITENDYIDYLSHSTVESIVPQQIRVKLTESQFLFLGYTMRDWNLRVFLQRMFGQNLPNNSWAVQRNPSRLDARVWKNMKVDLFAVPLAQYVDELGRRLAAEGSG